MGQAGRIFCSHHFQLCAETNILGTTSTHMSNLPCQRWAYLAFTQLSFVKRQVHFTHTEQLLPPYAIYTKCNFAVTFAVSFEVVTFRVTFAASFEAAVNTFS